MEKPLLKKHRLDKVKASILNQGLIERAYVAGSTQVVATFEIIYFDPSDEVSKHGVVQAAFAHGLPPGDRISRPEIKDLDTWSRYDGRYAWASTGIDRETLELFESFHPKRMIEGRRQEVLRDIRQLAFDKIWNIYDKITSNQRC